jgi:hypothetical protein
MKARALPSATLACRHSLLPIPASTFRLLAKGDVSAIMKGEGKPTVEVS